ncbi:MAG: serine/threonine-protein kinase [Polyangiales bacterium]
MTRESEHAETRPEPLLDPEAAGSTPVEGATLEVEIPGETSGDPASEDLPRRVHGMMKQGVAATFVVAAVDLVYARWVFPGTDLRIVLGIRLLALAMYVALVTVFRATTGRAAWRTMWGTGLFLSFLFALVTHATGGLRSLYPLGLVMLAMGAVTVARPRAEVLALHLGTMAVYVLAFVGTIPLFSATRAQLGDGPALATFLFMLLFALASYGLSAEISGMLWSLRREVFESKRVGRYVLRRRIGRGGMGEVWSAWHVGLRREVAVKFLHTQMNDTVARRRFEREFRATSALQHPHTVRILDAGIADDGQPYYAMELLSGASLREVVEREGPLDVARALVLVEQAARALGEAHARGIVHRDVKPENLFVCDLGVDEHVKVLDFGVARVLEDDDAGKLTATGFVVGTPAFMAPEVVMGKEAVPASDVYALGSVLYFALAGKAPFEASNAAALLLAQVTVPAPRLETVRSGPLDPRLTALLERALAKEPAARFADGAELAAALAEIPRVRTSTRPPVSKPFEKAGDAEAASPAAAESTRSLRR